MNQNTVTVMVIGDVVGAAGMAAAQERLRELKAMYNAALVVVNGENAADGYGLTAELADALFAAGADVITSGNHVWEKREFWPYMNEQEYILRPANYPAPAVGLGMVQLQKQGVHFAVINIQGRKYMPVTDCPFRCFDFLHTQLCPAEPPAPAGSPQNPLIIVDFHAEANEEKEALGLYLDGRAALIAGTHTHVQTTDEKILPAGAAYITDLGMTGGTDGVIGMKTKNCLARFVNQIPVRMECADGSPSVQGVVVHIDRASGRALDIARINTL